MYKISKNEKIYTRSSEFRGHAAVILCGSNRCSQILHRHQATERRINQLSNAVPYNSFLIVGKSGGRS
jgi:hypothetical protein